MGLKSFNPYTASRRFITVLDKSQITKQTPEKSLARAEKALRRPQQSRRNRRVASRRRPQEAVSPGRFPARQSRRAREGGGDRIRPESQLEHRAAALRRWREALHPAPSGSGSWRDGFDRRRRGHSSGQCAEDPAHSSRHDGAQPGAVSRDAAGRWCVRRAARRSCSAKRATSRW